jgi:hypothetical protein
MKKYTIELGEELIHKDTDGNACADGQLALQVYQDLTRMSHKGFLSAEDNLIRKTLEQILEKEFNKIEDIPMPEYYTDQ